MRTAVLVEPSALEELPYFHPYYPVDLSDLDAVCGAPGPFAREDEDLGLRSLLERPEQISRAWLDEQSRALMPRAPRHPEPEDRFRLRRPRPDADAAGSRRRPVRRGGDPDQRITSSAPLVASSSGSADSGFPVATSSHISGSTRPCDAARSNSSPNVGPGTSFCSS